jgi:hypothetical protein
MKTTNRLNLTLLFNNQTNKEVLMNENMNMLDCLIHPVIKSISQIRPPNNPAYGDIYIVPNNSAEWKASPSSMMIYLDEWVVQSARVGFNAWLEDSRSLIIFDGNQWLCLYPTQVTATDD